MWLERGRSTAPADRQRCEGVWIEMYALLGKERPRVMWWDGPATGSIARTLILSDKQTNLGDNLGANLGNNLRDNLGDNLRANLGNNLWANLMDNLGNNLGDNLGANLGNNLRTNLRANLGNNLWDNLGNNLWANLRTNLRDNLGDNLWANLRANLRDNLRDNLGNNLGNNLLWWFWGRHEAHWEAHYAFPHLHIRPMHTEEQSRLLMLWLTLSECAGWWHPFENVVIACEPPEKQAIDTNGRLHCDDGPAMLCRDGWAVYAWHGVRLPEWIIEKPQDITVKKIDGEPNTEIRRIMVERYGTERFLKDGGAQDISKDACGTLYRREMPDDEPLVMVHVLDPSTDREYFLRVPPAIQTAQQAVAWTFEMDENEYQPVVET